MAATLTIKRRSEQSQPITSHTLCMDKVLGVEALKRSSSSSLHGCGGVGTLTTDRFLSFVIEKAGGSGARKMESGRVGLTVASGEGLGGEKASMVGSGLETGGTERAENKK